VYGRWLWTGWTRFDIWQQQSFLLRDLVRTGFRTHPLPCLTDACGYFHEGERNEPHPCPVERSRICWTRPHPHNLLWIKPAKACRLLTNGDETAHLSNSLPARPRQIVFRLAEGYLCHYIKTCSWVPRCRELFLREQSGRNAKVINISRILYSAWWSWNVRNTSEDHSASDRFTVVTGDKANRT
jgi:hypothetical protein